VPAHEKKWNGSPYNSAITVKSHKNKKKFPRASKITYKKYDSMNLLINGRRKYLTDNVAFVQTYYCM
jgi:hypothetical protein